MKRIILSLLVVGLFASVGTSAIAKDTATGNQPAGNAQQKPAESAKQTNFAHGEGTVQSASKVQYSVAKDKAFTQYRDAKAKCERLQGDAMTKCGRDARTAQTEALAQAKTQWDSQSKTNGAGGDAVNRSGNNSNTTDGAKRATDSMGKSAQPKNPQ